jgi:pimeloyl-ACP methyl ester carboxylesterase
MQSRATALKTIRTDTLEIAFEESGPTGGQPVIPLHGFPDNPRGWDGVVTPLALTILISLMLSSTPIDIATAWTL